MQITHSAELLCVYIIDWDKYILKAEYLQEPDPQEQNDNQIMLYRSLS